MNNNYYESLARQVSDSFQAFLVEGATFTKGEEYPILESDMISKDIPENIMPFNKALHYQGDLSKVFVATYAPDESFERVRRNPQCYVNFFKRTAGIIGFDFSIHSDMPIVKQKSQMYDNLALSYYYGKQGIPIIPNLRCGVDELLPEFLETIPTHSLVAIGTHGFIKTIPEKAEWYCIIEEIINKLKPSGIIVYGNLSGKIFGEFEDKCKFYYYEPWIKTDRRSRQGGERHVR